MITSYFPPAIVSLAGVALVFGIVFGLAPKINFFQNQFFERDAALSYYDTNGDQVSNNLLRLITFSISICTVALNALFSAKDSTVNRLGVQQKINHKVFLFFYFGLGLASVILSTECATTILKKVVGSPRPSAFYMCNYKGYADAVNSGNYTMYNSLTTVNAKGYVSNCYDSYDDAWSSFPSGHASLSFATMTYSTMLLRSMLNLEETDFMTLGNLVAFGPLVVAAWISLTRLTDNKHHVEDLVGGALIGALIAVLCYQTVNEYVFGSRKKADGDQDVFGGVLGRDSEGGVEVSHKPTLEDALLRS